MNVFVAFIFDGMGRHLHGRPETRDKDRDIREELRNPTGGRSRQASGNGSFFNEKT